MDLTRAMFILPQCLEEPRATGVLDSVESVRQAAREYLSVVEPQIRELRHNWRRSMEIYCAVRFAA